MKTIKKIIKYIIGSRIDINRFDDWRLTGIFGIAYSIIAILWVLDFVLKTIIYLIEAV
jgi:hypothetical protein